MGAINVQQHPCGIVGVIGVSRDVGTSIDNKAAPT